MDQRRARAGACVCCRLLVLAPSCPGGQNLVGVGLTELGFGRKSVAPAPCGAAEPNDKVRRCQGRARLGRLGLETSAHRRGQGARSRARRRRRPNAARELPKSRPTVAPAHDCRSTHHARQELVHTSRRRLRAFGRVARQGLEWSAGPWADAVAGGAHIRSRSGGGRAGAPGGARPSRRRSWRRPRSGRRTRASQRWRRTSRRRRSRRASRGTRAPRRRPRRAANVGRRARARGFDSVCRPHDRVQALNRVAPPRDRPVGRAKLRPVGPEVSCRGLRAVSARRLWGLHHSVRAISVGHLPSAEDLPPHGRVADPDGALPLLACPDSVRRQRASIVCAPGTCPDREPDSPPFGSDPHKKRRRMCTGMVLNGARAGDRHPPCRSWMVHVCMCDVGQL